MIQQGERAEGSQRSEQIPLKEVEETHLYSPHSLPQGSPKSPVLAQGAAGCSGVPRLVAEPPPPMLPHPVCGQAGGPLWLLAMGVPPHPPGTLGLSFAEAGARVRSVSGAQTRPGSGAQRCCKVQELPWGAAEQRPALKGRVLASPPCLFSAANTASTGAFCAHGKNNNCTL